MNHTLKRLTAVCAVVGLLMTFPFSFVSADTVEDKRQELAQLQQEQKEIEASLNKLGDSIEDQQAEVNQLIKKIKNLESQIDAYKTQIKLVDKQIAEQDRKITELNTEIVAKEKELESIIAKLKKRMKAITKTGNYSSFQLLMSMDNYTDYLLKSKVIESVSAHDKALCDKAEQEKAQISQKKAEVEQEKKETEEAKGELLSLKGGLDKQFGSLDALYKTAQKKQDALEKKQNTYEKRLAAIKKSEEELDREIAALLNNTTPSTTYGGSMYWPAPTVKVISSQYGTRWNRLHGGTDIANGRALGEPIVAAANGTVIKVQKLHYSYGNFCMVDHGFDAKGRRIVTLYAHMRYAPSVVVGQQVVGGQTQLGVIGNTGNSFGAHLHFEVHVDGVRVDAVKNGYIVCPK
jgi:murein DD-endopeptidase MepM/ murein hydrolase activator NlpD